jgi:hypothetical protein
VIHVVKILFAVFAIPTGLMFAGVTIGRWRKSGAITRNDAAWGIAMPMVITAMGIFEAIGLINGWA